MNQLIFGDNLQILNVIPSESVGLIYVDPPFNTGKVQKRESIKTIRSETGDRMGFAGKTYKTQVIGEKEYSDTFDDFIAFLEPRIEEAYRILKSDGSFFLHLDYREVHYAKIMLDGIFGRENMINEIIWSYDYGARSRSRWSCKHDNILWYVKDINNYVFNYDEIDRIPYMAPGLVGEEKAKRGKTPTDVWWNTIVPTNGKEKTGYPTQKPLTILNRIITVHSSEGDTVLDFFAGSGTTAEAAAINGRYFIAVDNNPQAIDVMRDRLKWCDFNYFELVDGKLACQIK